MGMTATPEDPVYQWRADKSFIGHNGSIACNNCIDEAMVAKWCNVTAFALGSSLGFQPALHFITCTPCNLDYCSAIVMDLDTDDRQGRTIVTRYAIFAQIDDNTAGADCKLSYLSYINQYCARVQASLGMMVCSALHTVTSKIVLHLLNVDSLS